MKIPRGIFSELVEVLLDCEARRVTKYYDDKTVVSATRKTFQGKIYKKNRITEIIFKLGSPNFLEREFIRKCKKVNEPFPVKKIQIKYINK